MHLKRRLRFHCSYFLDAQGEKVAERVPSPSGEGGAKRRVRVKGTKFIGHAALTRPSGTLSRRERVLALSLIRSATGPKKEETPTSEHIFSTFGSSSPQRRC